MMVAEDAMPPLALLLSAHAGPGQVERHRALWAFDARLAQVARTTSEPTIGQMRLAWWNDVVDDAAGLKGQGEPVVDAMRATGAIGAPGLCAMIDGWEILVVEPEIDVQGLRDYAAGRGGGLFRALAGVADVPAWLDAAGQVWALWDLAGHVGDPALAQAALGLARDALAQAEGAGWTRAWKPLRIAFTLARQDVLAGRGAPVGMPRALALRLLRIALVGR
ncbi:squalene/phytoene synthase family protein [Sphingobium sp. CR2-8]|uniref:squalene/phytoene synthase family protein n=1 Tax=Sphingobium sp. CR2-8 TaxID=1306534 RepID=UPI002DBF70C8|nr:squalene/phytoene synthase family protein [Sphingobium sp. CR2-8]MEC3910894.1 squalene/phytoene synthase family protein [Sphingobium sp. CR2-8]